MIIEHNNFLDNPKQYSDAVILTRDAFEELHTTKCIQKGKAQLDAGEYITFEDFKQHAKDKLTKWSNK